MVIRVNHSAFGAILLLAILTLQVEFQSVKAEPSILVVPDQYAKIEWAIGNATSGDTIFVLSGTYYEHLTVNKPLILLGENKESTIIDGLGENRTIINTTADNVVISEFTVQNTSLAAGTSYAGIKVSGRSCNITGNFVTKTKIGILVDVSQRSRITENIVKNCGHGIALYSSSEVTVEANRVSSNTMGISLALSTNNLVTNNIAMNSSSGGHGIYLSGSSNNTIFQNNFASNYHGIWLSNSSLNWIIGNTITDNELLGIELSDSSNNTIYHNNSLDNLKHIVIDAGSIDVWDNGYPSGGNLWSSYTGVDTDGDGVGDTPHVINTNNQDRHPLIVPVFWNYSNPVPVIWNGVIYSVAFSSNSSLSKFQFNQPQMQISFNTTPASGTFEFCNVTIPKNLLNGSPWEITIDDTILTDFLATDNATHSFLYFIYTHADTSNVKIQGTSTIPEFSSSLILMFTLLTLLTATFYAREKRYSDA